MKVSVLHELIVEVEAEGYEYRSEAFEKRLRAKKVERCSELKGFSMCSGCPLVMDCAVKLAHLKDGS